MFFVLGKQPSENCKAQEVLQVFSVKTGTDDHATKICSGVPVDPYPKTGAALSTRERKPCAPTAAC